MEGGGDLFHPYIISYKSKNYRVTKIILNELPQLAITSYHNSFQRLTITH